MSHKLTEPFVAPDKYGYSCQTVLSKRANEFLHSSTYHCWFSMQLNPSNGGNSSNPLWLYQTLSQAVRTEDVNDPKVKQIRTTLMEAVSRNSPLEGSPAVAEAIVNIRHASIELFRPQLWRVDIGAMQNRVIAGHQYRDERKIEDLKCGEFQIIVE